MGVGVDGPKTVRKQCCWSSVASKLKEAWNWSWLQTGVFKNLSKRGPCGKMWLYAGLAEFM